MNHQNREQYEFVQWATRALRRARSLDCVPLAPLVKPVPVEVRQDAAELMMEWYHDQYNAYTIKLLLQVLNNQLTNYQLTYMFVVLPLRLKWTIKALKKRGRF